MKGNEDVIQILQDVLCAELTAINQYFIHARMCENWRYKRLAAHLMQESIGEMKHAQLVIDRILYFDGVPNMQKYMKINVGKTVTEQHQLDVQLEYDAVARLNAGIELCRAKGDNGTRALLEDDPEERRGAHRLARGAASPDPGDRHPELPGPAA